MADDWVVDSLVCFLQSPIWKSPVHDFIEQSCIVFDKSGENESIYAKVHSEYQAMVEKLVESFTTDLGITAEKLADACVKSKSLGAQHEEQLQSLLASEDFDVFKAMMIKKNIDLELEALAMFQKQTGHSINVYQEGAMDDKTAREDEEKLLQEVLAKSREEYDLRQKIDEEEFERMLKMARQESLKLFQLSELEKQQEKKAEAEAAMTVRKEEPAPTTVRKVEKQSAPSSRGTTITNTETTSASGHGLTHGLTPLIAPGHAGSSEVAPGSGHAGAEQGRMLIPLAPGSAGTGVEPVSGQEAAQLWLQSAMSEEHSTPPTKPKGLGTRLPDDLKARELYLRKQRDRLLKSKKKAREDELRNYKAAMVTNQQPKAAATTPPPQQEAAAATVSKGTTTGTTTTPTTSQEAGKKKEESPMAMRKTGILCSVIARKLLEEQSNN